MNALAVAQDAPAFRFQSAPLRPLTPLPRSSQPVAGPAVALPAPPGAMVRAPRLRSDDRDMPAFLRRQRLRGLAALEPSETFTIRTTDGAAILAELSLGFQAQVQTSDNINSAPPAQAIAEEIFDFTPVAQLTAGGIPRLQSEDSREPELYLNAIYAPTEHQLLRAGRSAFLHHLLAQAGRSNAVVHAGVRLTYDENLFAAGNDSSPEETYALLEVRPVVEYRASVKTTVRFRSDYRRITFEQPDGNRTEGDGEAWIDYLISPKTIVSAGFEAGRIHFDRSDFGTQDYRQGSVSAAWKATAKITFRTRIGVEWREFHRPDRPPEKVSVVGTATLEWRPTEKTRVAASFETRNEPTASQSGSLFRRTRYGIEAEQDLGYSYYARCEVECVQRDYDTGREESEITLRPAVGYRILTGAVFDRVRLELFYQYRRHWTRGADGYDRNQCGIQLTAFF